MTDECRFGSPLLFAREEGEGEELSNAERLNPPSAVACAVPSAPSCVARNPLRTADTTTAVVFAMRMLMLALLMLVPVSLFGAFKSSSVPQVSGYKAVRVRYGPMNKMIIPVTINGQPANLLVDTGSNQIILDADAASSFGIRPSQRALRYIRFTRINGQLLPVGFAQSLNAGGMNFSSGPVTLRNSFHSNARNSGVDGLLGLDFFRGQNQASISVQGR